MIYCLFHPTHLFSCCSYFHVVNLFWGFISSLKSQSMSVFALLRKRIHCFHPVLKKLMNTLVFICSFNTVDPWTIWVWTVRIHWSADFFSVVNTTWCTWLNQQMWSCSHRKTVAMEGPLLVIHEFLIVGGSALITFALFKGQL